MGSVELAAQVSTPSECTRYELAYDLHKEQKYDSSFVLAQAIASSCLRQGDTLGAATAMYLQALPSDQPERAISIIDSALIHMDAAFRDTLQLTLRLLTLRSRKLMEMERYQEGLASQAQLDQIVRSLPGHGQAWAEAIFNYWLQRAYWYEEMGLPEMAIAMYRQGLSLSHTRPGQVPTRLVADCHSRLAQRFRDVENLVLARDHARRAIEIMRGIPHPDPRMKAAALRYRSDYGVILDQAGELDSAAAIFRGIMARECAGNPLNYAINQSKLGHVHLHAHRLQEAWNLFSTSRKYIATNHPEESSFIRKLDINLAVILLRQGHPDRAILLANRILAEMDSVGIHKGNQYASLLLIRGQSHFAQGQIAQALAETQQAITSTLRLPHPASDLKDINPATVVAPDEYLRALELAAKVHEAQFAVNQNVDALAQADAAYSLAVQFLAYIDAKRIDFSESHYIYERLWIDHRSILEHALRCKLSRYDRTRDQRHLRSAIFTADIARGRQIYKSQLLRGEYFRALVPPQVAGWEQALMERIDAYQGISATARTPEGQRQADSLAALWSLRQAQFQDQLARYYPRYHQFRYGNLANLAMTSALLSSPIDRNSAELTYFEGNDTIYAFLRTAQGIEAATIPHKFAVERLAETFLQHIASGRQGFDSLGQRLFSVLLPFSAPLHPISHLLIIPDGFLFKLPFDALTLPKHLARGTEPVLLIECADIIEDFSLQAHYHAQRTLATMPPPRVAHEFVPVFKYCDKQSGKMITHPQPVYNGIMKPLQGFAFLISHAGPSANCKTLLRAMTSSAIVQLTTHGIEQETRDGRKNVFLLLSGNAGGGDKFETRELYGIPRFHNRMFVLNACLTASGDFLPGEGPLSFARGLRQAGCPTVLSNRWYASIQANAGLLGTFYAQIALGKSPMQALRTAKRTALRHKGDSRLRHPIHWSGMAIYGGS